IIRRRIEDQKQIVEEEQNKKKLEITETEILSKLELDSACLTTYPGVDATAKVRMASLRALGASHFVQVIFESLNSIQNRAQEKVDEQNKLQELDDEEQTKVEIPKEDPPKIMLLDVIIESPIIAAPSSREPSHMFVVEIGSV
ncbi:MAG: hypothetical protein EZS28_055748, partial [Streblomastix strix]